MFSSIRIRIFESEIDCSEIFYCSDKMQSLFSKAKKQIFSKAAFPFCYINFPFPAFQVSVSLGSLDKGPLAHHVVNCWSDVYSFGMTILHTFIGDELFERFRNIFFKPTYRASAGLFSECFKDLRGASNELLDLLTRLLVG